jgi:chromate transporter
LTESSTKPHASLSELALVFLKLGTVAFGGPAAHIALMENEFVRKRGWIEEADFLDRLAAANLLAGPSSTELAIFIGYAELGWPGLIVAGCCFIVPASVLVSLIAAAYVRFGALPNVAAVLHAIQPAVIAIIIQAMWNLRKTAAKTGILALIGIASAILNFSGVRPLLTLLLAGVTSGAIQWFSQRGRDPVAFCWAGFSKTLAPVVLSAAAISVAAPFTLWRLFLSFLKIGSVVFGSGYTLLAFLRAEFVDHLHWLTEKQLLDAVAVGQFTPGPVFTTATFIGYLLGGLPGACLATLAIFIPGFVFVAASGPLVPKIRRSPVTGAVFDGVVAGSLALIAVVVWQLGKSALTSWQSVSILAISMIGLFRFKLNSAWLIAGAAIVGWIARN